MRFSLVVATINRNIELFRLLESLVKQTYPVYEVIIVDQNFSTLLHDLGLKDKYRLNINIVKPENLLCASAARNFGANYVSGDIVSFPDDDCWYEEDILERVKLYYEKLDIDVISGTSIDPIYSKSNNRFRSREGLIINYWDIPRIGIEYSFWTKAFIFKQIQFDESISPGSNRVYQAGEMLDWFLLAYKKGFQIYYVPSLTIYHPFKPESIKNLWKEFTYSAGFGYVLSKNRLYGLWLFTFIKGWFGLIGELFRCNWTVFLARVVRQFGRLYGLFKL